MIFGHEGLPRSGKSLEAMQHVVDAIRHGRHVVTNVHGINKRAIADYTGIPIHSVELLLTSLEAPQGLDEDQQLKWYKQAFWNHRIPDSLWIWDEINQFWPPDRQPLSADWAKFVTEHGHLGIDILIMGQDLTELHQTWRKRLQRYTRFTKMDMMGKEDHYHWATLTNVSRGRFKQTAQGKKPYNKDFFGFYKSHRDETTNKGNYKDARFSVFQTKHKFLAVLFGFALVASLWYVWGFFHPEAPEVPQTAEASQADSPSPPPAPAAPAEPAPPTKADAEPVAEQPQEPQPIDYLDRYAMKYDVRLSGILDRKDPQPGQAAFEFVVDFLDAGYKVRERMSRRDIVSLGWTVERHDYGVLIAKEGRSYVVRPWPLDQYGQAPQRQIQALKPSSVTSALAQP
ncbi:zonular occludens toxin domain-containing protein [Metapseudomonas otitidis]|nr:zonular occludens toxin domain-containing protein [Pseudomonas otitidis]QZX80513.1 zonular occludens toxin domain-containing protein [Pseudomonas otitidis]